MNERECHHCSPKCFQLKFVRWRIFCAEWESWDQNNRDRRDFRNHPVPHWTNKQTMATKTTFLRWHRLQVPALGSESTSHTSLPHVLGRLPRCLSWKQSEARLLSQGLYADLPALHRGPCHLLKPGSLLSQHWFCFSQRLSLSEKDACDIASLRDIFRF